MPDTRDRGVPAFDDDELTSMLARTRDRSGSLRRQRRRRRLLAGAAGVCGLAACLVAALVLGPLATSPPSRKDASRRGGATATELRWKLVSDVGALWHLRPSSDTTFFLTCPAVGVCYAEANGGTRWTVEVTTDGGAQWTPAPVPAAPDPPFGCMSATVCAALGGNASSAVFEETLDGGRSWREEPFPGEISSALSCATATSCVAVADASGAVESLVTSDGGTSWTAFPLPAGWTQPPSSIQCFAGGGCAALGDLTTPTDGKLTPRAMYSTDGGRTWATSALPPGVATGWDIACSGPDACLATVTTGSGQGGVVRSTDGGRTWALVSAPLAAEGPVDLNWTTCGAGGACFVSGIPGVGGQRGMPAAFVAGTTDQGASWQVSALPTGVDAVGLLSCPAATACYALGSKGLPTGGGSPVFLSTTG